MMFKSSKITDVMVKCWLMNVVIFGGSVMAIRPLISYMLHSESSATAFWVASWAFDLLWCWPIFILCLVANSLWYRDMFDYLATLTDSSPEDIIRDHFKRHVNFEISEEHLTSIVNEYVKQLKSPLGLSDSTKKGTASTSLVHSVSAIEGASNLFNRIIKAISDEIIRTLLLVVVTISASWIAYGVEWIVEQVVKSPLGLSEGAKTLFKSPLGLSEGAKTLFKRPLTLDASFPHVCGKIALYYLVASAHSFHVFDYRWSFRSWSLETKLRCLQTHALYFAGYGFPMAAVLLECPTFVSAGVYAALFPIFVLLAFESHPERYPTPRLLKHLTFPVFWPFMNVIGIFLYLFVLTRNCVLRIRLKIVGARKTFKC